MHCLLETLFTKICHELIKEKECACSSLIRRASRARYGGVRAAERPSGRHTHNHVAKNPDEGLGAYNDETNPNPRSAHQPLQPGQGTHLVEQSARNCSL